MVHADEGLLFYNPFDISLKNGLGIYSQNFDLKNISQHPILRGASLNGITSIRMNGELYIIGYGSFSYLNGKRVSNDLLLFSSNSSRLLSNSISATSIDTVIALDNSNALLIGNIDKIENIPAQNALICDLIQQKCKVLNDGINLGLRDYLYLFSASYDRDGKIIYILYLKYFSSSQQYFLSLGKIHFKSLSILFSKKIQISFLQFLGIKTKVSEK